VVAWQVALERRDGPTALILTRQNLSVLDRALLAPAEGLLRGGYILKEAPEGRPEVILIGTGSEVEIALAAADDLAGRGVFARVVALPSWELFQNQDPAYKEAVLPAQVKARVAIEAGSSFGWERYVGDGGAVIGIDHFGASAPAGILYQKFGLTAAHIVENAMRLLGRPT
jgi:transketolase